MAFCLLIGALCILGEIALLVFPLVCTMIGSQRCASCWTRLVSGGTPGEFAGQHKKLPVEIVVGSVISLVSS